MPVRVALLGELYSVHMFVSSAKTPNMARVMMMMMMMMMMMTVMMIMMMMVVMMMMTMVMVMMMWALLGPMWPHSAQ